MCLYVCVCACPCASVCVCVYCVRCVRERESLCGAHAPRALIQAHTYTCMVVDQMEVEEVKEEERGRLGGQAALGVEVCMCVLCMYVCISYGSLYDVCVVLYMKVCILYVCVVVLWFRMRGRS